MTFREIFFNRDGKLRSGWRVLAFFFLLLAFEFVFGTIVRVAYALMMNALPGPTTSVFFQNLVFRSTLVGSALLAGWICTRLLERLSWRSLGLWFHPRWFRDFLIGSAIGIASLALATGIAVVGGGLRFTFSGLVAPVFKTLVVSFVVFVLAALAEEALFRGYPLQTLTRERLFWVGAFVTSLLFVLVHVNNPNFKLGISVINLVLAGIWFAIGYFRTRSLWFPLGLHWSWNWALGSLFGLPVSGINEIAPNPLLRGSDLGPVWLTGGDYGIEGGIACTVALIISSIVVWKIRWVRTTEEMMKESPQEGRAQES